MDRRVVSRERAKTASAAGQYVNDSGRQRSSRALRDRPVFACVSSVCVTRVHRARKICTAWNGFFGRSFGIGRDGVVVVTSGCGAAVDLIDVSIEETRNEGRRMRDGGMGPFALCE